MVRICQKLSRATLALEYFTTRDWQFKSNNVIHLNDTLDVEDRKVRAHWH